MRHMLFRTVALLFTLAWIFAIAAAQMQATPMQASPTQAAPMQAAPTEATPTRVAGFIGSCIDINDSKDAEEAVRTLTGRLINAQEDERRHIARELHDDINQSLALLAIEIERVAATIPSFVNGAGESVCRLSKRVVETSQHVQAISHQLHSSQLELLGLDLAVRNCCEEYTRQRNVKVDYKQNGLATDIPADVSLCVFRLFQKLCATLLSIVVPITCRSIWAAIATRCTFPCGTVAGVSICNLRSLKEGSA